MLKAVKGFETFCVSDKNGLCLIAMPTGAGKTFHAIDYIAYSILSEQTTPIVFTTPLNKNVLSAYSDILKRLFELKNLPFNPDYLNLTMEPISSEAKGIIDTFCEKVVLLRSYEDTFKEVFKADLLNQMRKSGFDSPNTDDLLYYVNRIRSLEGNPAGRKELPVWQKQFRECEGSFREDLKKWAKKEKKKKSLKDFLHLHPWLGNLYPSVKIPLAKVIVLSIDKFVSYADPFFGENRPFYLMNYVDGALVFIDEFDATKEWILRRQIETASELAIDLTASHFQIQSALSGKFPYASFDDGSDPNSPKSQIGWLRDYFERQAEIYHLDYTLKTDEDTLKNGVYLFDDGIDVRVVSGSAGYVSFLLDETGRNQLRLRFSSEKNDSVQSFIPTIKAFSNCRTTFVRHAVKMCRYYYDHRSIDKKTFDPKKAVSTIMAPFHDPSLTQTVMDKYVFSNLKSKRIATEGDFYLSGLRYYSFVDRDEEELTTSLNMVELAETPEKFLLGVCQRAMVVGLSATAKIDTVTGNYDMDFLSKFLKGKIYRLSQGEEEEIREICQKRIGNRPEPKVVPIDAPSEEEKMPAAVFSDKKHQEKLDTLLFNSGCDNYLKKRFVRFLLAIKEFVRSEGRVMLLMSTDNPDGENNLLYTKKNIESMCSLLMTEAGKEHEPLKVFAIVGSEYEKKVSEYFEAVKTSRCLLLSSYQTAGTGQNLQYQLGLDDLGTKEKHDIDTIYLEYPTNVVVDMRRAFSPDIPEKQRNENLLRFLYQVEAMSHRSEISRSEGLSLINSAFEGMAKPGRSQPNRLNTRPSANKHRVKILIQAVGRICRVPNEEGTQSKPKLILADSRILGIDFSCLEGEILNPEFEALVKMAKPKETEVDDRRINLAVNNSLSLLSWINDTISKFDSESMRLWKDIREYVLKHPRIRREDLDQTYEMLYIEPDTPVYYTNGSETEPKVSWKKTGECQVEVSEKTSRLRKLMEIDGVRDYFNEKGYATFFGEGELMLGPVAFANIYLGALGEAVGKAILEHDGFILEEIENPDVFELFDYRLKMRPSVYIDFKHWKPYSKANHLHSSEDFQKKLEKIGGDSAFVINILADGRDPHSDKNIHFFPSLWKEGGGNVTPNEKAIVLLETLLRKE